MPRRVIDRDRGNSHPVKIMNLCGSATIIYINSENENYRKISLVFCDDNYTTASLYRRISARYLYREVSRECCRKGDDLSFPDILFLAILIGR